MPGSSPDKSPPDMRFLQALRLHRSGDVAGARAQLEAILDDDPDHQDALEVLGKICEEMGEVDRAIELTRHLALLAPNSIMANANLSRFFMLKGDKETAEEWQAKARVLGWKEEIGRKGEAAGAAGATERPIDPATLEKQEAAVAADPDSIVARMALASSYRKLEMPIKAVGHLREALKRDPDMSVLYLELGKALEAANLPHEALPVYETGVPIADRKGDLMPRNQMASRVADLKKRTPSSGGAGGRS